MKNVFRRCLNVCRVLESRIPVGSLFQFQTVGAAKLKARLLKFVL